MAEQTQEDVGKGLPADFVKAVRSAEAPFREAVKKYQDGLTPEGKAALEKIAHEEGKAAVEAYKQSKSLESPEIEAFRNLVADSIQISSKRTLDHLRGILAYPDSKINKIEELAKKIGIGEVDKFIAEEGTDNVTIISRIKNLGYFLNKGIAKGTRNREYIPERVVKEALMDIPENDLDYKAKAKNVLLGMFVGCIADGGEGSAVGAIVEMASWDENKKPADFIEEYKSYLNESRNSLDNKGLTDKKFELDASMQSQNFIWSPGKQGYLNMNS